MKKCTLALLVAVSTSHASTLLDYTYDGIHRSASPGIPITFASRFSLGSQDVELNSINFMLAGTAPYTYDFTAYIFSDNAGQPGALLGSSRRIIGPAELPGFYILEFYDFAFSTSIALSGGEAYWAGIGTLSAGGPPYIATTDRLADFVDHGIGPSLLHATGGGYPPTSPMTVNEVPESLVYRMEGTVIPEPSVGLLLLTLVCVQVGGYCRRVSQC